VFKQPNLPVLGLAVALAVIAAIGSYGYRTVRMQLEIAAWVEETYRVIHELDTMLMSIASAESAARGFALSRDESLAREVDPSIEQARRSLADVRGLLRANARQSERLDQLEPNVERRITLLQEYMSRVGAGGPTRVLPEALERSHAIRRVTLDMMHEEQDSLNERIDTRGRQTSLVLWVSGIGLVASLIWVGVAFLLVQREMKSRLRVEHELRGKHAESLLLLQLGELLQAARTLEEGYDLIGEFAPRFFEDQSGAMFLHNAQHNQLELRSAWRDYALPRERSAFTPDDCWALRRGRPHWYDRQSVRTACKHLPDPPPSASLCLPMLAHGELLGLLHVDAPAEFGENFRRRAAILGEQVGMALANLALREKLRNLSIRDPLTGLFNRRYTEETLDREIRRAARSQESLAVLMMDVDHFKRFNDTFGHQAGDQVLREIGKVLATHTRGGDVVSRMGGEELLAILPSARAPDAERKAEELRAEISKLRLLQAGRDLGEVTVSIGVALYPQHGVNAEELFRAADAALYAAKRAGRDRVVIAA
jgi:diguanylate cyclase (GGDEF)-like protein